MYSTENVDTYGLNRHRSALGELSGRSTSIFVFYDSNDTIEADSSRVKTVMRRWGVGGSFCEISSDVRTAQLFIRVNVTDRQRFERFCCVYRS